MPKNVPVVAAADGRPLGARAVATRAKLLTATAKLLSDNGILELKVVDIAREVDTSPATFYQYFVDVDAAILALAEQANVDEAPLVTYLADGWAGDDGLDRAKAFIDAYVRYWDDHQAVLRLRNVKAEEGDPRFRASRTAANLMLINAMVGMVREAQEAGRLPTDVHPFVMAGAAVAIAERILPYRQQLVLRGASLEDQRDTVAWLLYRSLTGR